MDIDTFLRDELSRRRFFRSAGLSVVGGSAVFLAACGDDEEDEATSSKTGDEADVEILNSALDLELMAVAAYKAGAAKLQGEVLQVGKSFLEQEQEHADALTKVIKQLGGRPNKAQSRYEFPALNSQDDVLKFAVDLENTAVAAYIDALPKLTDGDLRATAAAIVTNEAEHISVLLGALSQPQVPTAFVTGKRAAEAGSATAPEEAMG